MALTGGNGGGASAGSGASGGGPGGNGGKSSKSTGNNGFKMSNPLTKAQATANVASKIKAAEAQGYTGFNPVTNDNTITATGTRTIPSKQKTTQIGTKKYSGKKSWVDVLGESGKFSDQSFDQMLVGANGKAHFKDTPENRAKWNKYME